MPQADRDSAEARPAAGGGVARAGGCPLCGHRALSPLRSDQAPSGLGGFAVTIPSAGQALPARLQATLRAARHSSGRAASGTPRPASPPDGVDHRTQSHLRQCRWHVGGGPGAQGLPPQASLGENGPADQILRPRGVGRPIFTKLRVAQRNVPCAPGPPPTLAPQGEGGSGRDDRRARLRRPAIREELPFGQ